MRLTLITLLLLASTPAQGTAMLNYNKVLEVSDGTTISVSREEGELTRIKLAPADPDLAVTSTLSEADRVRLMDMLEGAVP